MLTFNFATVALDIRTADSATCKQQLTSLHWQLIFVVCRENNCVQFFACKILCRIIHLGEVFKKIFLLKTVYF